MIYGQCEFLDGTLKAIGDEVIDSTANNLEAKVKSDILENGDSVDNFQFERIIKTYYVDEKGGVYSTIHSMHVWGSEDLSNYKPRISIGVKATPK